MFAEEVYFEFHPVFERWERESSDYQRASIVWLGTRPAYLSQGSRPNITAEMHSNLIDFIKNKQMDEKMFRALVRQGASIITVDILLLAR